MPAWCVIACHAGTVSVAPVCVTTHETAYALLVVHPSAPSNVTFVGADGCRGGWLFVAARGEDPFPTMAGVAETLDDLMSRVGMQAVIALDMPIGLPSTGARACDVAARKVLGWPRRSSVFPAPVRAVLPATTYEDACAWHERVDGRRLTLQAFHLLPKIREVDALLQGAAALQGRVREVHPEVSWAHLTGAPIAAPKRSREGRAVREEAIERVWPGVVPAMREALRGVRGYAADDLLDALVNAWTARRLRDGEAACLPEGVAPRDAVGLPMEICA